MTALPEYARLETTGLWADAPNAQRREVVVSFGDATLVLSDKNDRPLAHWSLAALVTVHKSPAKTIYSPLDDGLETLEIDDATMNEAITKIKAKYRRGGATPGLVRRLISSVVLLAFFAVLAWFPHALSNYATSITPDTAAQRMGAQMLTLRSKNCTARGANRVLQSLAAKYGDGEVRRISVTDLGTQNSARLPGGVVLIDAALIESQNGPEALVGHILYQRQLEAERPALYDLFRYAGFFQTIAFLTGSQIDAVILKGFANRARSQAEPDTEALIDLFKLHDLSPLPFARTHPPLQAALASVDISSTGPVLSDNQWAVLEGVCLGD